MGAVSLLVRTDLRRRWRSSCVLVLVVGVVGAVVLAAAAGARRTAGVLPRLMDVTRTEHASLEVSPEYFDAVAGLPEVAAVAPASYLFLQLDGLDGDLLALAGTDDRLGDLVDRPLLREGRRPSPTNAAEVLVNVELATRLGIAIGDPLTLSSLAPAQLELLIAGDDPGEPQGAVVEVVVVGVGVTPDDFANRAPIMLLTPAFYDAHREDVAHFDDILQVRLARGDADLAAFSDGVARVVPESEGAIVESTRETASEIEDSTDVQATALAVLALAAAVAGFVAIGQVLARHVGGARAEQPALRALGLRDSQRALALVAPMVLVALAGAVVAVLLAFLVSPATPTGFARRVEPERGIRADGLVLGVGFVAIVVTVAACALISAWRVARSTGDLATSSSQSIGLHAPIGTRPAIAVGARNALRTGRGRSAVPVRPALVGAVAGVAGLIAALTFGVGLDRVVTDPAAYGWQWDASVRGPGSADEVDAAATELAARTEVDAVAALSVLPIVLGGQTLSSYGLDPRRGSGFVAILDGRLPAGDDEVFVGSTTLDRLDARVGDVVAATGLEGGAERTFTIVGRGVFPEFVHPAVPDSDTGSYDDFALVTEPVNQTFAVDAGGEYFGLVLVRWAPGVDAVDAAWRLEQEGYTIEPPQRPSNLGNLTQIRTVPLLVAGFLALVGVVALTHALVSAVQRRARELAVLRALGFVPAQVRATLATQASIVAAVGLVLGIPVGLVVGRVAWGVVARRLGIADTNPMPTVALLITVPATLLVANLVAVLPAASAVRAGTAPALRSGE